MIGIKPVNKQQAIELMDSLGQSGSPFLFVIDFDQQKPIVIPIDQLDKDQIQYSIRDQGNFQNTSTGLKELEFKKWPVSFEVFNSAFKKVQAEIQFGNSFLLNLAFKTRIEINRGLYDIFQLSKAPYKLWIKDQFVCFSPETFVTIKEGKIYSFPMKGTIDAGIPNAEKVILNDEKEKAEHYTIVDLIRNDLGMVSTKVEVENFRYIDKINTNFGDILQVSSKISGVLPENYKDHIGELIFKLLPAGSVTGAPKERTVSIIKEVENFERKYYTGIFGVFNGKDLDSGVMIRYIEQEKEGLFFKSGGGITFMSDAKSEYEEMIKKVYVPIT